MQSKKCTVRYKYMSSDAVPLLPSSLVPILFMSITCWWISWNSLENLARCPLFQPLHGGALRQLFGTILPCPKQYQHVHTTATTQLRISVWRKHNRVAFASNCSKKGCNSVGKSQNPLASTLGTILHTLYYSVVLTFTLGWLLSFLCLQFVSCTKSPLPLGYHSSEQPKRDVADHVFRWKAGFNMCVCL